MREALARSDLDFTISEDEGRPSATEPARLPKILRVASGATACVIGGVIVVNALFLQDRKHPAPLLRAPDPIAAVIEAPAPLPKSAALAAPPVAASVPAKPNRDAIADEIGRMGASERKAKTTPAVARNEEPHGDAIAALIAPTNEPNTNVMAAQRALVKLGYVLRADGVVGATTKQAIEHYERANKRPVRGELTPKLARELTAKAGIAQ